MHARAATRTYVGRLEAGQQAVYAVEALGVERLSPPEPGFGWGVDAIGDTMELARALLSDTAGSDPGGDTTMRFAQQILLRLPHDGFTLRRDTVGAWLRRTVAV